MSHPSDHELIEDPLAPEVARHLASCPRCRVHRKMLDGAQTERTTGPVTEPPTGTPLTDDGGSGRVLVWDKKLDRCVVHVTPGSGDAAHLRALVRALEQRPHPHIARVHGVFDGPPLRYARDRVPGTHLGMCDVATDPRAVSWLGQAASALAVLHEQGFAHGGLSDTTVRITPQGRVRLVDIGLDPMAAPEADWAVLAELFAQVDSPVSEVLEQIRQRPDENSGAELLAWLVALRDPGAGGGPRYEPRGLLGIGGMGEVQRVFDPVLGRVVAQKVLSRALVANAEQIGRFLEEAHITAQLQHPAIVPVHDLEHLPDGGIAFTMKQLEGQTLAAVIREVHEASSRRWQTTSNGWSLRRLVEALRRVCDAVAYAHAAGIVHLDLKPGNVMLGEYGEVMVFDWGLARRLEPTGQVTLDRASGTAGYMPPEQAKTGAVVGREADIFALGASLREILDGTTPTRGGAWSPMRSDAPRELVSVVRRATQTDPEQRYRSATELARDLAAWQDERPVGAHQYRWWEIAARRIRPHLAPIAVSVVSGVILLALVAVAAVRVQGERDRSDGMLAQSLVDRANLAWDARDPIRAEAYAAAAVGLAGRSDARGLLARLARGWRPALKGRWSRSCNELVVTGGDDAMVVCATDAEVDGWSLAGDATWSVPGVFTDLREVRAGWTATTHDTLIRAEATSGEKRIVDSANAVLVGGAVVESRSGEAMAVVLGTESRVAIRRDGLPEQSVRLDGAATGIEHCSGERFAVSTHEGGLFVVDFAGSAEPVSLGADRVTPTMSCSPNGRLLAVASDRNTQIWSLDPAMQKHILMGHLGAVVALAWGPDSRTIATASEDGTVRLWDSRKGTEIGRLPGHDGSTALAFSPDGRALLTATRGLVRHWELPADPTVDTFDAVVEIVALRWAADGSLYTLDRLGRPEGFDAGTGLQTHPLFMRVQDLDTDPTGGRVAVVTKRGDVQVLDIEENLFAAQAARAHAGGATAVEWHPSEEMLVSGGMAGDLHAWRVPGGEGENRPLETAWETGLGARVEGLACSSDGSVLTARTKDAVVLIDGATGRETGRYPGDASEHDIGPDARQLALAWDRGGLSLGRRSGANGAFSFVKMDVDGHVVGLDFAPEAPFLASVTREGLVQVFDTTDGSERARLFAHPGGATDIAFSRDGTTLASAGTQGEVVMFDATVLAVPEDTLEGAITTRYGVRRSAAELEFE